MASWLGGLNNLFTTSPRSPPCLNEDKMTKLTVGPYWQISCCECYHLLSYHSSYKKEQIHHQVFMGLGWPPATGRRHPTEILADESHRTGFTNVGARDLLTKKNNDLVFIIDEAQTTYGESHLWFSVIKDWMGLSHSPSICLFSSYSSPSTLLSMCLGAPQISPFYNFAEFHDFKIEDNLKNHIYSMTNGHPGMVRSVLEFLETPVTPTIIELCLAILQHFCKQSLYDAAKIQRFGPSGQIRPPEAVFQDVFYQAFWQATQSRIAISSEWTEKGSRRINFYVVSPGWGFELLQDRDRIEDHCARFQKHGIYHPWIQAHSLHEWIMLDCHHSKPITTYPNQPNLWRVVFLEEYSCILVLDCKNQHLAEFGLVNR
ncbi:uncharacterized protein ASPGLDRAFT_48833 [Aspergillus glaucus CBS 516.65]|uniref:Uncharacterized protein n=1 Tax=Aspergillus glaucus CBS 516.65 TaxID=1160497 RepID=A0A1L9VFK6_ASPGL|nr:hypothetical protein ASPGLDRAFT_48833 [Aspergillus glaucus CBS 516.65]OJJ82731.1 hypothetical protein ASPGLDRAFT_48833 [Aspergillus glaucus CBS 516.65]